MQLSTITFAKTVYRISDPLPSWFERSVSDHPECSQCNGELIFCFPSRIQPELDGFGSSYQTPVAVRCGCFVRPDSATMVYHQQLCREPVPVTVQKNLT